MAWRRSCAGKWERCGVAVKTRANAARRRGVRRTAQSVQNAALQRTDSLAFAPPSPPVTFKYGMNQVFGVAEPGKSTETIYLGKALTLDGCKKKCLRTRRAAGPSPTTASRSALRTRASSPASRRRVGARRPTTAKSSRPGRGRARRRGLLLNGKCGTARRVPTAVGRRPLRDAAPRPGGATAATAPSTATKPSPWAARCCATTRAAIRASEMTAHCGIGAWAQNSRIHATRPRRAALHARGGSVGVFSHEPMMARAPTGEYDVLHVAPRMRPSARATAVATATLATVRPPGDSAARRPTTPTRRG